MFLFGFLYYRLRQLLLLLSRLFSTLFAKNRSRWGHYTGKRSLAEITLIRREISSLTLLNETQSVEEEEHRIRMHVASLQLQCSSRLLVILFFYAELSTTTIVGVHRLS